MLLTSLEAEGPKYFAGMLKPADGQPAMGRHPGLEELSQEEKMLHLRLTRNRSSERAIAVPWSHMHPSTEEKGKARNFFCS